MIIIDEQTEQRLIRKIESARTEKMPGYCLRLAYSSLPQIERPDRETLVNTIRANLPSDELQLYFCADGDAYLFATYIKNRELRALMGALSSALDEASMEIHELAFQPNLLLLQIEQKLDRRHRAAVSAEKRQAEEELMRRRQEILHLPAAGKDASEKIAAIRRSHRRPEIMIIEDDAFSRRLVEKVLPQDFHLTSRGDAQNALHDYVALAPNLLFLDINLPDVTGHELLERIMQADPDAYVIMLSGNNDRQNVMRAMENGARGFVAKPFTREKIYQYIQRCPTLQQQA
jgi:two-component system chemotaxis response regulator CheY